MNRKEGVRRMEGRDKEGGGRLRGIARMDNSMSLFFSYPCGGVDG